MILEREILGLLGGTLILVSMCFNTQTTRGALWLRFINCIGSVVYIIYGIWLQAYSVIILNVICLIVDIIHLFKLLKQENYNKKEKTNKENNYVSG